MKILNTFFYVIFLCVLSVLLLEGMLRFSNSSMKNYNIEMWKYSGSLKKLSENKILGHEHKLNTSAILQSVEIRTNEYGLRDESIKNLNAKRRILSLGSSIALGWGVNENKTMTHILEKKLRARGQDVDVLNAGIGNYNALRYTTLYFEKLYNLKPTDIIVNFFLRDAEVLEIGGGNILLRNSQLAVTLFDLYNRTFNKTGEKTIVDHYKKLYNKDARGYKIAIDSLKRLSDSAKKDGINIYLTMIPDIHNLTDYKLSFIHDLMKANAEKLGFVYIDMYPMFKGLKPKQIWAMKGDPHPNAFGHELMAEAIYPYFL